MNSKTNTTCKKDGNHPHMSQRSIKICKPPCSMVRSEAKEKENLSISCQISQNDFCKNEEYYKYQDNTGDMGMPSLSFNGSMDLEVATDYLPSVSSCSETMLPYYIDRPNSVHYYLSEAVNWEEFTWPLEINDNYLATFQMPNVLDSNAHDANQSGCLIEDTESQCYVKFSDVILLGTKETTSIIVEETTGAANYHDDEGFQLEQICDSLCFDLICHQVSPCPENAYMDCTQLDTNTVCFFDLETSLPINCELSETSDRALPALVSQETVTTKNITLVLDLDETLVHSSKKQCDDADFIFQMYKDKPSNVYVRTRPFLREFLEKISEMFEIIIFTASRRVYAEKVLDILDPHSKLFSRRLYRDSCSWIDNRCAKDLRILGVDLAKVAIIDNTPDMFRLQVNNGIPIKSWFDDPTDSALISLMPFLEKLVDVDDVRPIIAEKYGAKN